MSSPLATVGILSIGEMGMGIAKLLIAYNYRVVTNIEGRSEDTHARAKQSNIELLHSDISLVSESDYILSIVPPRDALATAKRITTALASQPTTPKKNSPFYYLDLNAISPRTTRQIAALFQSSAPEVKFIDGGIIGGAPEPKNSTAAPNTTVSHHPDPSTTSHAWNRPSIPLSGPDSLSDAPISGAHLAETLNARHVSGEIGAASGLKCCFASTTKGFTALCIQAFTTAQRMGVLDELKDEIQSRMPGIYPRAVSGVTGMPPKAYRWVREMEEIGVTFAEEGGFTGGKDGEGVFGQIAEVYRVVADDTVLGEEKTERRKRGLTLDDVTVAMSEGLERKRKKKD
ncbi:6-phosphogluconate dehydrogenase [Xylogone sp. PMI_703]|nr:6-phosphogluconate dehydrogenase [Xylogone sp. PMI_703]